MGFQFAAVGLMTVSVLSVNVKAFSCEGKQEGNYADSSDATCKKYYICMGNNVMVQQECQEGEFFDVAIQTCRKGMTKIFFARMKCSVE